MIAASEQRVGRVGAIDIGTNSVLLLVADVFADAQVTEREVQPSEPGERDGRRVSLRPAVERATITRLGQGVDESRALAPEAIDRTLACLASYGEELRALGVTALDVVGTSAMRDARGAEGFRAQARALLGVEPRVIAGDEEARLTFAGGLSGIALAGPVSVFDIGGGSTELIRGSLPSKVVETAVSVDVGSVRLTERHVRHDPPTAEELARCRADIERALDLAPAAALAGPLVGVAGTVTTIAAIAHEVDPYDASKIHGVELTLDQVRDVTQKLADLPLAERVKLPGLSPKRADVIVAGSLLCQAIVERAGARRLLASDRGVRWGLAEQLAARLSP